MSCFFTKAKKYNQEFEMLYRKHQARDRHCERSEAISNTTVAFSAYHGRDCHGPSGLAMTFCKGSLQSKFKTFVPHQLNSKQKPEFNWCGIR